MKAFNGFLVNGLTATLLMAAAMSSVTAQVQDKSRTFNHAERSELTPLLSQTVRAKYEGGVFGYNKKQDGAIGFDDPSRRLVFRDNRGHEMLSLSYDAVLAASTNVQSTTPFWVEAAGAAPYGLGTPAQFLIKTKSRYLLVQYREPETQVFGVASFKVKDKAQLAGLLRMLASKTELTPRGDFFARGKSTLPRTTALSVLLPATQ